MMPMMPMMPMMGGMPGVPSLPSQSPLTDLWMQFVHTQDPDALLGEFSYTVEQSSVRKPNAERDAQNASEAAQMLLPMYQQYAMATGDVGPLNAFIAYFFSTRQQDSTPFILPPPKPPQPGPPQNGQGPVPEGPEQRMQPQAGGNAGAPPPTGGPF